MTIIETILKDRDTARRAQDQGRRLTFLGTLLSEASIVGKNASPPRASTDEECVGVVRKFLKNAQETRDLLSKTSRDTSALDEEIDILIGYLPRQMTEEDLERAVAEALVLHQPATMGPVMAHLKRTYGGTYDAKAASVIVKKALERSLQVNLLP